MRSNLGFAVQLEQAAPRLFRKGLVIDPGIGWAPAVRGGIDFDFGGQVGLFECLF